MMGDEERRISRLMYRLKVEAQTEQERLDRCAYQRAWERKRRERETDEERELRLAKRRAYDRARRAKQA